MGVGANSPTPKKMLIPNCHFRAILIFIESCFLTPLGGDANKKSKNQKSYFAKIICSTRVTVEKTSPFFGIWRLTLVS